MSDSYEHNHFGFHRIDDKRPRSRQRILHQVAVEFGEKEWLVEKLWKDYRELERATA